MTRTRFPLVVRTVTLAPGVLTLLASAAPRGTGTMRVTDDGRVLDFCVSVRFNATAEQIGRIEEAFENGSAVLADATDGQLRFGRVSIFDDSAAGTEAEVWIMPDTGGANAIGAVYGVRGTHVTLFYARNIDNAELPDPPDPPSPPERYAYTIAHELAHSLWGLLDEYSGPSCCSVSSTDPDSCMGLNPCDCEPYPGSPMATYSLMDNYFIRGGNTGSDPSGTGTYTLNELCTEANHDPDGDTYQQHTHGVSCWTFIENHWRRPLVPPPGLPEDDPPAVPAPDFTPRVPDSRFVLCIDRSPSMDSKDTGDGATRLFRAKQGAHILINLTEPNDDIGIVAFASTADALLDLTEITPDDEADDKDLVKAVVTPLETECCMTAIGLGLEESQGLIAPLPAACNQPIILLSDGMSNKGPSELDYIDGLIDDRIPVITLAIGEEASEANLIELSSRTGGSHYHVILDSDLPQMFSFISADAMGDGVIAALRGDLPLPTGMLAGPVYVDEPTGEVSFVLSWNHLDNSVNLVLVDPDGNTITEADALIDPDVDLFTGLNQKVMRVKDPLQGNWRYLATVATGGPTKYDFIAIADTDDVALTAVTDKGFYGCGEPIRLTATPRFLGLPVVGAVVDATVQRPDGVSFDIALLDDGGQGSGDVAPDDGEYTAVIAANALGPFTFMVSALNLDGLTYEGELLFADGTPPVVYRAPQFTRVDIATAEVLDKIVASDLDGDGDVDGADLGRLLGEWGPCDAVTALPAGASCIADLNCDGIVGAADLAILLSDWTE